MVNPPPAPAASFSHVQPLPVQIVRVVLVVLCAAGWLVSIDLLRVTGGAASGLPILMQFCGAEAGEQNDCRALLSSSHAGVGSGAGRVPWAALGAGYFSFVLLWMLLVGVPHRRQMFWHWMVLGLVGLGAGASVYLVTVLLNLKRFCAGCVAVHAANALIFLLMIALLFMRKADTRGWSHPKAGHAVAALLAGVLALQLHVQVVARLSAASQVRAVTQRFEKLIDDPELARWDYARQPLAPIALQDQELFRGSPEAANTVVVFSDLQCERCKAAHELLEQLVHKHPRLIRVAFRHYPLDWSCNDATLVGNLHPQACAAARAVAAVASLSGGEAGLAMLDSIYERQEQLGTRPFAELAGALGINEPAFAAAFESAAVAERVQADVRSGQLLKLRSVPAVFLNGRRLTYWHKEQTWERLLGVPGSQPATANAERADSQPANLGGTEGERAPGD